MDRIHREARLDRLAQCPMGHDTRHYYKWLDEIDELTKQNAKLLEACKEAVTFISGVQRRVLSSFFPLDITREYTYANECQTLLEQAIAEAEGQS